MATATSASHGESTLGELVKGRQVSDIDPISDERWASLVMDRRSDVFHSPAWLSILRDMYGFDIRARLNTSEQAPDEGIVYATIDDVFGRRLSSLPFSDFCDPLISTTESWFAMTGDLGSPQDPFTIKVLFDDCAETDPDLKKVGEARWHRCDVRRDPEEIWADLHPGARRAIRKSASAGVTVRRAESIADMRAFFELHLRTRKLKYGLLAQPWAFFEMIWDRLLEEGSGDLLVADLDGEIVAGVVFLRWKDTMYYKFNASSGDALDQRPNDAIMWEGIQLAHGAGDKWLDFGVSDTDQPGLIRYKEKYSTESGTVRTLKRTPASDPPGWAAREILPAVTALLTAPSVPDDVTERAGDLLYQFFA